MRLVEPSRPRDAFAMCLGFIAPRVAPLAVMTIPHVPYMHFRGARLAVGWGCAPHFEIVCVSVGSMIQGITACGPVPAECFPPLPTKLDAIERAKYEALLALPWDTCEKGVQMAIQVRNLSIFARDFRAAVFGVGLTS